ncbi:MAG: hypothetical protein HYW90_02865 [Candidatus Sungbacteria bacterium]|nr:hypothetical protein [Candidatus Sungbacteria bacterium]
MEIVYTGPFKRDYKDLPQNIQRALGKALGFLLENIRHSSLRAKKLPGTEIWYARISRGYRFTFQLDNQTIILRRAGTHDILNRERK